MAPKKFTYTPGTGGGKRTKAFAKKGAASKAASAKDKAALEAWANAQQARGAFGPVTGAKATGSKPAQFNLNAAGMGSRSPLNKQVKGTVGTLNEITGVAPAQRIAQGKGSKADIAVTAMSVLPVGKGISLLAKGGKAAVSGIRGAEAVASTTKAGTKAFGKTKGVAAIKKASASGRQSVIAKRTESDAATIKRGTQKSKTAETAKALEQQAAKENASKSVFEGAESTVRPLAPAPAGAKMPTGMTKAEIKKFGEGRSKALGSGGKQGRSPAQRAQVGKDIEETIKSQLAARTAGARAGAEIPGELGARRVGGPAADAATAAPARAKATPKPGPKQALRENARLTAEPTGKPKVPSARASQAVKDQYAKDLAAYNRQQAKFEKQQAAIKQKTTDIEMGKVKAPSAKETGKPLVKTGPAKAVKKPKVARPKPGFKNETEAQSYKSNIESYKAAGYDNGTAREMAADAVKTGRNPNVASARPKPSTKPKAPAAKRPVAMKSPTKAGASKRKFGGNMKAPAKTKPEAPASKSPIERELDARRTRVNNQAAIGRELDARRARIAAAAKKPAIERELDARRARIAATQKKASVSETASTLLKGRGTGLAKSAGTLGVLGAAGIAVSNKRASKAEEAAAAAGAKEVPPTTDTQAKKDARHPSPDVWLDKYGRRISEAEFNRRKTWWAKAKKMDKAEFDKAYNAEVARRRKYTSGAGTKKFGAAATTVTMNKEVPKGVAPRIWNSMSESEKTRFQFKYKKNTRKAVFDLLKGKQTPNR